MTLAMPATLFIDCLPLARHYDYDTEARDDATLRYAPLRFSLPVLYSHYATPLENYGA